MDKKQSPPNKSKRFPPPPSQKNGMNLFIWFLVFLGLIYLFQIGPFASGKVPTPLTYGKFYDILSTNADTHAIKSAEWTENIIRGELSDGSRFVVNVPEKDDDVIKLLRSTVKDFDIKPPRTLWMNLFISFGPLLLFIVFLWYMYRGAGQMGGRIWSFGKSRAMLASADSAKRITFDDVAGVEEAKEELKEAIEFLKDPKKFQRLGGKIPKGILLLGPPGCGKTLLAKAVAGEAGVPFLSISGSDFVEMFVGVGASRVRDLFEQAKRAAKQHGKGAIIFMDEIDAVGRQRFAGIGGGHDEREQTLNALLVEIDGFNTQEGVILIAATNRPDVLDPALLRPGRFDRHIVVHLPDIVGREAILKVHTRAIKLDPKVDLKIIARQTSLFSGADLANLCNEAALLAARLNKQTVERSDLEAAIERVIMGPEKKSHVMSKREKELTAFHEAGHALLSLLIPGVDPMSKVSVIPRGMAGGYTLIPPTEDKRYKTKTELLGEMVVALGGRASEEINFGDITTGAMNDLEVVAKIARSMVCDYGMSDKLGNISLGNSHGPVFLGRDLVEEKNYSDDTARMIDQEVKKIIDDSYARAKGELLKNKGKIQLLADRLLEKEVLDVEEVKKLLGFIKNDPQPQTESAIA